MNKSEYEALLKLCPAKEIRVEDLKDQTPRTLLIGEADADQSGRTTHIYLSRKGNIVNMTLHVQEGKLYHFSYGKSIKISDCRAYNLLTAYSDFEFCSLLLKAGSPILPTEFSEVSYEKAQDYRAENLAKGRGAYVYPTASSDVVLLAIPGMKDLVNVTMKLNADDFGLGAKLRSAELVERLNGILNREFERFIPLSATFEEKLISKDSVKLIPAKIEEYVARYFELETWRMPEAAAARLEEIAAGVQYHRVSEILRIRKEHDV